MSVVTERSIARLWQRMAKMYGHRWTTNFGLADDGTWLTGLSGLTTDHLSVGLQACLASGDEWPPVLPAFRRMCVGMQDPERSVLAAMNNDLSDPLAARLRATLTTWDAQHMSARDLRQHFKSVLGSCAEAEVERRVALPAPPHAGRQPEALTHG